MLERLLKLQDRGRSLINSGRAAGSAILADADLKKEIEVLYRHYRGRTVSGCKNCYVDALIELCTISKTTAMSQSKKFVMRRGKVLKDIKNNDARLNLVRGNETDELALYHLYTNPRAIDAFEAIPDAKTLKKMLAEYGARYEAECKEESGYESGDADKIINDAIARAAEIVEAANAEAAKIIDDAKANAVKTSKPKTDTASDPIME